MVENPTIQAANTTNSRHTVITTISTGGCGIVNNTDIVGAQGVVSFTFGASCQVDRVANQAAILAWSTAGWGESVSLLAEGTGDGCAGHFLVGTVFDRIADVGIQHAGIVGGDVDPSLNTC